MIETRNNKNSRARDFFIILSNKYDATNFAKISKDNNNIDIILTAIPTDIKAEFDALIDPTKFVSTDLQFKNKYLKYKEKYLKLKALN
jgi:hypothetical protein